MRDETRIAANALLAFVSQAVTAAVGILLVPFLLSRLGEETYGVIGVIGSMLAFMTLIDLGLGPANARQFTRFLFEGEVRRSNELASSVMALYLMLALLVLAVTGIGREPLLALFRVDPALWRDAGQALVLAALSLGFTLVYAPYRAALFSGLRHYVQHYTHIIFVLARAGLIVGGFRSLGAPLAGLGPRRSGGLDCSLPDPAPRGPPALPLAGGQGEPRQAPGLPGPRQPRCLHLGHTVLPTGWTFRAPPLIISFFLGTAVVAHFTPALVLATVLLSLSGAFLVQLQPLVTRAHARSDFAMIGSILMRSTRYSLLLTGGAAVGVGALLPR